MGILDSIFHKDDDKLDNVDDSTYKTSQTSVLGKDLAPKTPQGNIAAVDPQHDTRAPEQFKRDAQNAEADATNSPDEKDSYHFSKNGNKYEKVDNSDSHQAWVAAANYLVGYFANDGDPGKAGIAAGQAVAANDAKAHRLAQADDLEDKGYNPLDIQNWVNSGDKKDLVTNKGEWQPAGQGYIFNNLTSEFKAVPGAGSLPASNINAGNLNVAGAGAPTTAGTGQILTGGSADQIMGQTQPAPEHVGFATDNSKKPIPAGVNDANGNPLMLAPGGGLVDTSGNRYTGQTTTLSAKDLHEQEHKSTEADTQIQATATQAGEGAQAGLDLLKMQGLNLAGPSYAQQGRQWWDKQHENNFNGLKTAAENYNHKLQQLGQAALYTESGGKRIFAEEMQTAGKNFILIDPETMDAKQIHDAVLHNNAIASRFQQYAKTSAAGKPRPNASQTQYGQQFAAPAPSMSQPGVVPQPQQQAPAAAIQALQQNPHLRDQFQAKYGYLPEGF
ncbi:hypothetical protein OL383_004432 [Salmonella enterica]|nr:hypothetical protein [Salmonella enterica]